MKIQQKMANKMVFQTQSSPSKVKQDKKHNIDLERVSLGVLKTPQVGNKISKKQMDKSLMDILDNQR